MTRISDLLYEAESGLLRMPEFQRGWVWKKRHVRELFQSLYSEFPIGSIIVWPIQGEDRQPIGGVIDGQQRLTALYSIIRGKRPPWIKDPIEDTLCSLMFNLQTEEFDFATRLRLDNPLWVNVSKLFLDGQGWREQYRSNLYLTDTSGLYYERIHKLLAIEKIDLTVSKLPSNMPVEDAARVFRIVNRAGTKVSEGDLVLGQLSLKWKDAREQVDKKLNQWEASGFKVPTIWLLHSMAAELSSRIQFDVLLNSTADELQRSFGNVVDAADSLFNILRDQCGLDHKMKTTINMGMVPAAYFQLKSPACELREADNGGRLIGWWLLGTLRNRWSADTRNRVNNELAAIDGGLGVAGLVAELRSKWPILEILPDEFAIKSRSTHPFYRLLYVLARRCDARDLKSGVTLSFHQMGSLSSLQAHHIFPRKVLPKQRYSEDQISQLANIAFITRGTNLRIGAKSPSEYLPALEEANPGVLASQWIPDDPRLWEVSAYPKFLDARRKLLADAANQFLRDLIGEDF